jgi:hypothetical protein
VNQKLVKPTFIDASEWQAIKKASSLLTEYFENVGLFINWVDDTGETRYYHAMLGNAFALENHVHKWADKDFDEDGENQSEEEEDD